MGEKVINLNQSIEAKKVNDSIQQQIDKKSKMYEGDFKRFQQYADSKGLTISFSTLESYLDDTVTSGLKLNTFNRRSAAVKHFLVNVLNQVESDEQNKRIAFLRQRYNDTDHTKQKKVEGQVAQPKDEVLALINDIETKLIKEFKVSKELGEKLAIRAKAISLFNLITASRPSEMVSIKIGDIDLSNRSVNIYLKKQKEWKPKRLTLEVVNAIRAYIKEYKLNGESYLVGKVDKHGNYSRVEISDIAYRKTIHKWLGFAPYTLRKTQVSAMHENGADLATIAKQSGHKNLETINKHYLSVNDRTVDKFL